MATVEELKAAFEAARAKAISEPTQDNREAVKAAWAAYDSSIPLRKASGYASRAGQRQAAERRERYRR